MTNARWSYGCTVFELATKGYLMHPPFVKGDGTFDSVKIWCKHHGDVKQRMRLSGPGGAMQRRVYGVRQCSVRRIVWHCCNPDPDLRTRRLQEELDMWGQEWTRDELVHQSMAVEP